MADFFEGKMLCPYCGAECDTKMGESGTGPHGATLHFTCRCDACNEDFDGELKFYRVEIKTTRVRV